MDRHVVTRPSAVALLFDIRAGRMLGPFLTAEHTLTTAARQLGVAPSTLAYWLPRFTRAGLLQRTRVEPRRGAPMRWYRAPARTLFVPLSAVPAGTRQAFFDAGRQRVVERFEAGIDEFWTRQSSDGITFTGSGTTGVDVELATEPSPAEPWTEFWGTLELTPDDARAMARELATLIERYRAREGGPVELVVHAGAVPAPTRTRRRRARRP